MEPQILSSRGQNDRIQLTRPQYCWILCIHVGPYYAKDFIKIEPVNQRATRFVAGDHSPRSSIIAVLAQLGLSTLEDWRQNLCLTLMLNIVKQLVAVPPIHLIPADSRTRANHSHQFYTICTSMALYKNSFILHNDIITSSTVDCFKSRMFKSSR